MTSGKIKHYVYITVTAVLLIFLFLSCSREQENKKNIIELRYGFTTEPMTLDPLNPANTADGRSILFNVFEGLVKPDSQGTPQPCAAQSWIIGEDSLVYTFTLRENVRFHDGSVVTAADVKFTLDSAAAAGYHGLGNIREIVIHNDNQIAVSLKTPDPEFLPYLTVGIVKAANVDREREIIGTGPFYIESYTPQRNLVMRKHENYWQENLPLLDKVTIVFFANYDTLMVAFRGGSIDGANITGSMAAQLDVSSLEIFTNRSAGVHLLALNNSVYPFNDINVRRAFNYGIDVQGIIDAAFFGMGTPSGSPLIPGLSLYYENFNFYSYNPDLARALLAQSGFNESNVLSLVITVPSNYSMHVDTAQVIAGQLQKIGVDASITLVDWPTWLSDVYFGGRYESTIITLDSPSVSPRGFLARYHSGNAENFINFKSIPYDYTYDAALAETNMQKRIALYKEAQRIIAENAASVYIQDILYFIALRGFAGAVDYPLYAIDFARIYRKE